MTCPALFRHESTGLVCVSRVFYLTAKARRTQRGTPGDKAALNIRTIYRRGAESAEGKTPINTKITKKHKGHKEFLTAEIQRTQRKAPTNGALLEVFNNLD